MKKKELKALPVEEENPYRSDTKFKATGISYPRNISSDIGIYMGLTMACLYGNQYPKLINDRLSTSDLVGTNTCIGKHTTFDQNPELKDILDQEKHRLKLQLKRLGVEAEIDLPTENAIACNELKKVVQSAENNAVTMGRAFGSRVKEIPNFIVVNTKVLNNDETNFRTLVSHELSHIGEQNNSYPAWMNEASASVFSGESDIAVPEYMVSYLWWNYLAENSTVAGYKTNLEYMTNTVYGTEKRDFCSTLIGPKIKKESRIPEAQKAPLTEHLCDSNMIELFNTTMGLLRKDPTEKWKEILIGGKDEWNEAFKYLIQISRQSDLQPSEYTKQEIGIDDKGNLKSTIDTSTLLDRNYLISIVISQGVMTFTGWMIFLYKILPESILFLLENLGKWKGKLEEIIKKEEERQKTLALTRLPKPAPAPKPPKKEGKFPLKKYFQRNTSNPKSDKTDDSLS